MKTYIVEVNNNEYEVKIKEKDGSGEMNGENIKTNNQTMQNKAKTENKAVNEESTKKNEKNNAVSQSINSGSGEPVTAPMSGKILSIRVSEGDNIEKNQVIMTLEAMKMETEIVSSASGKISNILVSEGDKCKQGDKLALIEAGGN